MANTVTGALPQSNLLRNKALGRREDDNTLFPKEVTRQDPNSLAIQPKPLSVRTCLDYHKLSIVKQQVINRALEHSDRSPQQISWLFTDEQGYFILESSTYRILKGFDLAVCMP